MEVTNRGEAHLELNAFRRKHDCALVISGDSLEVRLVSDQARVCLSVHLCPWRRGWSPQSLSLPGQKLEQPAASLGVALWAWPWADTSWTPCPGRRCWGCSPSPRARLSRCQLRRLSRLWSRSPRVPRLSSAQTRSSVPPPAPLDLVPCYTVPLHSCCSVVCEGAEVATCFCPLSFVSVCF